MKIPKKFKLMGRTIRVRYDDELPISEDKHGMCDFRTGEIILQPPSDSYSYESVEETFWHEYAHYIMFYAGSVVNAEGVYIHQNEELMNIMAGLFHQSINSMGK